MVLVGERLDKNHGIPSPKLTFLPLKVDGWKMIHFLLGFALFSGAMSVSFREGIFFLLISTWMKSRVN